MTALKAHEVARFVARPDPQVRLLVAYGPDGGLAHETAKKLAERYAEGPDASLIPLEGSEIDADPARLAVEIKTISLFGGRRVILVRGTSRNLAPTLNELKGEFGDTVVVVEAGNLVPKDALRALAESASYARALPCYPDSEETLNTLTREVFSQAGIAVDPDAFATLRSILGNDREITRRELEKLVLFAAQSKRLTEANVLTLCADNAALVIDEIVDATGTGHAVRLDEALARARANNVDPQRLLSVSLGHFAALRRWRALVDAGRSARDVLDSVRPKPHFSRRTALEQQLRLWSDGALATAGERILVATAESRRAPDLGEALLRRTLLALCRLAAEA